MYVMSLHTHKLYYAITKKNIYIYAVNNKYCFNKILFRTKLKSIFFLGRIYYKKRYLDEKRSIRNREGHIILEEKYNTLFITFLQVISIQSRFNVEIKHIQQLEYTYRDR